MKTFLLCICSFFIFFSSNAQKVKGTLSGTVTDSTRQPLDKASIRLLHAADSTAAYSVLSSEKGTFKISDIAEGKYLLVISYLGYKQITRIMAFTEEKSDFDLGVISMKTTSLALSGITVEQAAPPVQLKGDTLEFNAGSFKTHPNAVVEELLKKIPGIQVDPDGTIKAEGETINQILVDGKPFFGDDPKIATKNLPADIIDKVQVFDKKSDQATFTGIDDGKEQKTINLKIKKDKKHGLFGKASAGAGTQNRFATDFNLFRFDGDQQISIIGSGNNTNQRNFSFRDIRRGGSGGGGMGNGNTTSWMGGINYRDDWGDKIKVTGDYFYNYNNNKTIREQKTQYILPDTSYYNNQNQNSNSKTINHRFNLRMDYQIDSMNSILFTPSISYSTNENSNISEYNSEDVNQQPINAGGQYYSASTQAPSLSGNLLYRKRFHKKGRTFSVNLNGGINNNDGHGINSQQTTIYKGNLPINDTIDQHFDRRDDQQSWGVRLSYTEPLSQYRFLEVHVAHNNSKSTSKKNTYNQNPLNGKYDLMDSIYSNTFRNIYNTNEAGLNIQTRKENYNYTLGFNVKENLLDNYSISGDSGLVQKTFNYYPEARFNYNFSRTQRLRVDYRGSTGQPSITQLQSVPDNTESLRKIIGNPDLKPSFTHNLRVSYRNFNRENYRMLFTNLSFSTTSNAIVNATDYEEGGKQIIHYENANGNYNLRGSVVAGFPIKEGTNMINSHTNISYNRNPGFINDEKNFSKSLTLSEGLSFNYSYKELLDFRVGGDVSYNKVNYSLQKSQNTNYFNYGGSLDFNINLPAHFMVQTNFRYSGNSGLSRGYNQTIAMWNASVSKYLFKDQKGMLKLEAFDLLNQQVNITRNITAEYIQDVRTNVIPQYFMLSFTYFLKKFPGHGGPGRGRPGGFPPPGGWRGRRM